MSELKMSDYFDKPVEFVGDTIECPDFAYATTTCEWEVNGVDYGHAIAHAINHHDKLVEENQRLAEIATKHATRADELYEALKDIYDEAVDYQKRTGKKVTWVESVSLLLEKRTVSNSNDY